MENVIKVYKDDNEYLYDLVKILEPSNIEYKYIIYKDKDGIYASRFNMIGDKMVLSNLMHEYEFSYVESVIKNEI